MTRPAVVIAACILLLTVPAVADAKERGRVGYGQVSYLRHGPEAWHWRYLQAVRKADRLKAELSNVRRSFTRRWRPTVNYALRLAAAAYGVSYWELRSVASCETGGTLDPFARNGQYRGLFQEGPMFEGSPFGRAGFSVWDPVANAMTAAYTVAREGWSQWECKP